MTKRQERIFVFAFMNTIMSVCMSVTGLIVNGAPLTLPVFGVTLAQSLVICNACNLVFRIPAVCNRLSMALSGGDPGSKAFAVWNPILNATANTLCMNTFMTLINVGPNAAYFPAWLSGLPIFEAVSIAVGLIAAPLSMKAARRLG